MSDETFAVPPGCLFMTTHGILQADTAKCLMDSRSFNDAKGLVNISYQMMPGSLVDKARNDSCRHLLREAALQWLIFVDADMTWGQEAIFNLLHTAYKTHPWADVVGGYCNLRGDLAIPTIDSGTGTWESHYPGSGVKEVMRTGAAFLLVKRPVLEKMGDPWFATRIPMRPMDALAELDNFARIKFDGSNPLRQYPEWAVLESIAQADPSTFRPNWTPGEVGEDSGFCDRARLNGFRIVVDTNIVTGHLHTTVVNHADHKKAMARRKREQEYVVGLWPKEG